MLKWAHMDRNLSAMGIPMVARGAYVGDVLEALDLGPLPDELQRLQSTHPQLLPQTRSRRTLGKRHPGRQISLNYKSEFKSKWFRIAPASQMSATCFAPGLFKVFAAFLASWLVQSGSRKNWGWTWKSATCLAQGEPHFFSEGQVSIHVHTLLVC